MNLKEEKTGGKTIYSGRILDLVLDDVRLPDGAAAKREIVRHAAGAAVLFVEDGKILLVKQFRYACGRVIYEIPAGMVNDGEEPVCAAARELEEETGYRAEMEPLGAIYPSPGYTDEVIYIFSAKNAKYTSPKPDAGEFLDCVFMPFEEAFQMVLSGEIADSKTVVAICRFLLKNKS